MPANSNNYPSLDIIRRSATNDPPPPIRTEREVAKLIDVSRCIGCKACEVACKQWNQLPADGFNFTGNSYDNTAALTAESWRHVKFVEQFAAPEENRGLTPPARQDARVPLEVLTTAGPSGV